MKVSIIGAGSVGATTAFSLAKSNLVDELVIVDLDERRAQGVALDILHGLSLTQEVKISAGDYDSTVDSNVIIVTIGVPEKVGESRLVPLQKNADILKDIVPKITKASPNGILLLVSNPVDILAYFAQQISGWDPSRVIGLGTTLDSARLNYLLARDLDVAQTDINGMIVGEHGDSQVVAWSQTAVKGTNINDFLKVNNIEVTDNYFTEIAQEVKDTAFDVWEMKGPNCYCVALAIERVIKAISQNENAILPVSQPFTSKEYISLPHVINKNGAVKSIELDYSNEELAKLNESYSSLVELANQIQL